MNEAERYHLFYLLRDNEGRGLPTEVIRVIASYGLRVRRFRRIMVQRLHDEEISGIRLFELPPAVEFAWGPLDFGLDSDTGLRRRYNIIKMLVYPEYHNRNSWALYCADAFIQFTHVADVLTVRAPMHSLLPWYFISP